MYEYYPKNRAPYINKIKRKYEQLLKMSPYII